MDSTTNSHLRTAGYAIALFDFLQTAPTIYALYDQTLNFSHDLLAVAIFATLRYSNFIGFIANASGFISTSFTPSACSRFHLVPVVFQMFAGWATEAVIIYKISTLSRRSLGVMGSLSLLAFFSFPLQIFGAFYLRRSVYTAGSCSSEVHTQWGHYDFGMLYFASHLTFNAYALCLTAALAIKHSRRTPLESFLGSLVLHGVPHIAIITLSNLLCTLASLNVRVVRGLGSILPMAIVFIMSQHLALHTIETRGQGLRGKVPGAMTHRELGSTDHQQTRTRRPSNHTEFDSVEIRRETIVGKDFLEQGRERGVEAADAFEMTPKVSTSSLTSRRRSSLIVEDDEGDDEATSEDMDGGPPSEAHSQLDTRFEFPRRPPPIVRYGRAD